MYNIITSRTAKTVPMAMTISPNIMTKKATILDAERHLSLESLRKQAVGMMNAKGTAVKHPCKQIDMT